MGQDVRDLLGMRSSAARVMALVYALTCLVLAFYSSNFVDEVWPNYAAALVLAVAASVLVSSAGDPMPLGQALAVGLAGPAACALSLWQLAIPVQNYLVLWTGGMTTALLTFLCVRGRVLIAWLCFGVMLGVFMVWSEITGQGIEYGLSVSFINAGPLLMATVFAYTIRPLGNSIFALREQSTRRIAAAAASAAVLEARDAKLDELDLLARPLLEQIASGESLSPAERSACEVLEARLRDGLRAPGLQSAELIAEAQAARGRGVEVVMLDDRGMDDAPEDLRARLAREVVAELSGVLDGTVTVRILPPKRKIMATILIQGELVRRVEFDHAGERVAAEQAQLVTDR